MSYERTPDDLAVPATDQQPQTPKRRLPAHTDTAYGVKSTHVPEGLPLYHFKSQLDLTNDLSRKFVQVRGQVCCATPPPLGLMVHVMASPVLENRGIT